MLCESTQQWKAEFLQQGFQQGFDQGFKQGFIQGQVKVIRLQMEKKFGQQRPEVYQKLENSTQAQLDEWALTILEATSIEELFKQ